MIFFCTRNADLRNNFIPLIYQTFSINFTISDENDEIKNILSSSTQVGKIGFCH